MKGRVNKRLTVFLIAALCCTLFSHSQLIAVDKTTVFDEILCRKLTVLDKTKNKPAIQLISDEQGNRLFVNGKAGKTGIIVDELRSGVVVYGTNPKYMGPGLLLSATESDSSISLYNKKGEVGVSLSTTEGNGMYIYDEKGQIGLLLSTYEGNNGISLFDEKGQTGVALYTYGRNGMYICDKTGEAIWDAP